MKNISKIILHLGLIITIVLFFNIVQSLCVENEIAYTVVPGDSINSIANKYDVSADTIIARNEIQNPNVILPGQVLYIPTSSVPPSPDAPTIISTPIPTQVQEPTENSNNSDTSSNNNSEETLTKMTSLESILKDASTMTISVNVSECDSKSLLSALALSMSKRLLMIREGSLKSLSFRTDDTPLMALFDLLIKYEKAMYSELGNTIIIEEADDSKKPAKDQSQSLTN